MQYRARIDWTIWNVMSGTETIRHRGPALDGRAELEATRGFVAATGGVISEIGPQSDTIRDSRTRVLRSLASAPDSYS